MFKPTILIIAGGNNSRFFPLNSNTHKGFIQLMGKPLVIQAIQSALAKGFEKFVLVISPREVESGQIDQILQNFNLQDHVTLLTQHEAKGMADAILTAKNEVGEHFIVASPYYSNLGEIADQLWTKKEEAGADCVLLASESVNPQIEGILELDGEKVIGVVEKPSSENLPSKIRVRSIYLFNQDFLHELALTKEEEYALETAYDNHAKKSHYTFIMTEEKLPTLKYAWHLFNHFSFLISQKETSISQQALIAGTAIIDDSKGPVVIEAGVTVGHAAKVVGPCYIGRNALVGDYCFVRGGCCIEEGTVVGSNTEVVRSIILKNSSIHYSYLADSIIGESVKIGAGLITANKRLDRSKIKTEIKGKQIDTDTNSFGVIVGEKVNLGIRTSTMPGVLIGANSVIYPGQVLYENVEAGKTVKVNT